jgi:hypothetical protein
VEKATANKPKPKPIKIDDFDEDLMVNTISKQIGLIKNTLFRVFFFKNINPLLNIFAVHVTFLALTV